MTATTLDGRLQLAMNATFSMEMPHFGNNLAAAAQTVLCSAQ
ncbi:hypothetical protein [Thermocatellispora tengchongensis]